MKLIDDNFAYINSLFVLIIVIPIVLLVILSIYLSYDLANDTVGGISEATLKSSTDDFVASINTISMGSIHNLSYDCLSNKRVLSNSTRTLKNMIQGGVNNLSNNYYKRGILLNCTVINIYPSNNPFYFDVYYRLESSFVNDSSKHISMRDRLTVSMVDYSYPVYDTYPLFKANVKVVNNTYLYLEDDEYYNATSPVVIMQCPYEEYTKHGHSNITLADCLSNHYYHFSNDGLCVFCRLENRTVCNHNGLETFIIPTLRLNQSTSSVDHVYLNESIDGHYNGSLLDVNNTSFIYLDNAHRSKYGL